jgi:putative SOS response-associated peptidase YedK
MCGRFTLKTSATELANTLGLAAFPQLSPRYNIAPTQLVICIRSNESRGGERDATFLRWGLIPGWTTNATGPPLINARSETAADKPAFRNAFRSQRCLIPADGFFEWNALNPRLKQPWYIHQPDEIAFCFAGLWETWQNRGTGQSIESCTILTTQASADLLELHERMPVILPESAWATWLSGSSSPGQLQALMQPLPAGSLVCHPVSQLVNKTTNDVPACIQRDDTRIPQTHQLKRQRSLFD